MSKIFACSIVANNAIKNFATRVHDVLPKENPKLVVVCSSPVYNMDEAKEKYKKMFSSIGITDNVDIIDLYLNFSKKADTEKINSADIIYLPGGNTYEFYYSLEKRNFLKVLKNKSNEDDVVFIGCSAGSIIMGPNIMIAGDYNSPCYHNKPKHGLNIIPYTIKPHWGNYYGKYENFKVYVDQNPDENLYGIYDGEFIYYDTETSDNYLYSPSGYYDTEDAKY